MHGDISLDKALIGALLLAIGLIIALAAYLDFRAPRSIPSELGSSPPQESGLEQDRAQLLQR